MNDALKSIYYDARHPAGFSSVNKLAQASGYSHKQVKSWLKAQPTYTLHVQTRKKYPTRRYIVHDIDSQWQMDLCEMIAISRYNNGNRYILTVIDIFSRYAWAKPLKSKRGNEVAKALRSIFNEGRIPNRVQSDEGKEFYNQYVKRLFNHYNIELFSTASNFKAAFVERFNRTLKNKLWRHFTSQLTQKWTNVLQDIIYAYNHSVHRIIKMRPVDVTSENVDDVRKTFYQPSIKSKSDIKIGDLVRISKVKSVFAKGYLPNWTEEIFTIASLNTKFSPTTYKLKDSNDEMIKGSFYRYEIQPITHPDKTFIIEKILKRRTYRREQWYFVKWLGHPSSMNSWVRRSDMFRLSNRK